MTMQIELSLCMEAWWDLWVLEMDWVCLWATRYTYRWQVILIRRRRRYNDKIAMKKGWG